MQISLPPPTPTQIPGFDPRIDPLPDGYGLWASTEYAIQYWYLTGDSGRFLQTFMLIAIVVIGLYVVTRFLKDFTNKDSNE